MKILPAGLPDICIIEPHVRGDGRGFFMETYQSEVFSKAGIHANFVQDNHSGSRQGVLRGMHYQIQQAQGKLVRVVAGSIFDVVVDLRRNSPACGQWMGTVLSIENKRQLWVPVGFAHGFYVLSEWAELVYKTTDFYAPQWERTLAWDDPTVGIQWPLMEGQPPQVSAKDGRGLPFGQIELFG